MSETNGNKLSNKALALAALADAVEEATRPVIRLPVMAALLIEATRRVEALQELVRARKPKKVAP